MTYARKSLICLNDTPYYHVVSRCVRRASLWGFDEYSGKDHSHRKEWVLERLRELASVFAIDICAYAVMSNHYHLALHVDRQRAKSWTAAEVVEKWTKLYSLPTPVERWQKGECDEAAREVAERIVEKWRHRLIDISWYMRSLNEHLARRANAEDECKGRFWEGRFRSQALLDEAGLLTAMAYVDLNPIRAGIARTPEESEFTSIETRIREMASLSRKEARAAEGGVSAKSSVPLLGFKESAIGGPKIPCALVDYLELIDWSGRIVRPDKPGAISCQLPALVHRLDIDARAWRCAMQPAGSLFGRALGKLDRLRLHARAIKQSWVRGQGAAARLFSA